MEVLYVFLLDCDWSSSKGIFGLSTLQSLLPRQTMCALSLLLIHMASQCRLFSPPLNCILGRRHVGTEQLVDSAPKLCRRNHFPSCPSGTGPIHRGILWVAAHRELDCRASVVVGTRKDTLQELPEAGQLVLAFMVAPCGMLAERENRCGPYADQQSSSHWDGSVRHPI